jgi:hypothetical protein
VPPRGQPPCARRPARVGDRGREVGTLGTDTCRPTLNVEANLAPHVRTSRATHDLAPPKRSRHWGSAPPTSTTETATTADARGVWVKSSRRVVVRWSDCGVGCKTGACRGGAQRMCRRSSMQVTVSWLREREPAWAPRLQRDCRCRDEVPVVLAQQVRIRRHRVRGPGSRMPAAPEPPTSACGRRRPGPGPARGRCRSRRSNRGIAVASNGPHRPVGVGRRVVQSVLVDPVAERHERSPGLLDGPGHRPYDHER